MPASFGQCNHGIGIPFGWIEILRGGRVLIEWDGSIGHDLLTVAVVDRLALPDAAELRVETEVDEHPKLAVLPMPHRFGGRARLGERQRLVRYFALRKGGGADAEYRCKKKSFIPNSCSPRVEELPDSISGCKDRIAASRRSSWYRSVTAAVSDQARHRTSLPSRKKKDARRTAHRRVLARKRQITRLPVDAERRDVIAALIAGIQKPASGFDLYVPRIAPHSGGFP